MQDIKLIELLKIFSKEDLKLFKEFLQSTFLKRFTGISRNIVTFYEFLIKYYPDFNSPDLEKEKVFRKMFPEEKYNELKMRNLIFDLTKSCEQFLVYNSLLDNESEYLLCLSKVYLDNNLPKHFEKVMDTLELILIPGFSIRKDYISKYRRLTQLKNSYYTGNDDYDRLIESKLEYFKESVTQFVMDYVDIIGSIEPAESNWLKKINNPVIGAITKSFDINMFLDLIKTADFEKNDIPNTKTAARKKDRENSNALKRAKELQLDIESRKIKLQKSNGLQKKELEREIDLLKQIILQMKMNLENKSRAQRNLLLLIYHLNKILSKNAKPDDYFELRNFFYEYIRNENCLLDREEKHTIFKYLLNFCTQRHNMEFMRESFNVYKKMLEEDAFSESINECMQVYTYRNILKVCITLRETEWLEYFIKNYTDELSPEHRDDMMNLSLAHIHFLKQEFEKSISNLLKMNDTIDLIKTDRRNLMLKSFYELKNFDSAFSLVDSYTEFLRKTKIISEQNKKIFKKFIDYYYRLLRINSGDSSEDPCLVKTEIEKEEDSKLVNKQWLLQKAMGLKR